MVKKDTAKTTWLCTKR